jgi:hypothetical protein
VRPSVHRLGRVLGVVLVNIVAAALLAEGVALAVWFAREHTLYYTRARDVDTAPDDRSSAGMGRHVLHPVLGFIWSPSIPVTRVATRARLDRMVGPGVVPEWLSLKANNYGFFSSEDYPSPEPADGAMVGG